MLFVNSFLVAEGCAFKLNIGQWISAVLLGFCMVFCVVFCIVFWLVFWVESSPIIALSGYTNLKIVQCSCSDAICDHS